MNKSIYRNSFERLVGELGLEGAKEEMRRRRGLVKNHPGGSFRDRAFAQKASRMRGKSEKQSEDKDHLAAS